MPEPHRVPWTREPLVHFFAVGVVLFALASVLETPGDNGRVIVVDEILRRELLTAFAEDRGRLPRANELQALIDGWIEGEVLYREGLELGLDRQERSVRIRVIDRMRQLVEGMAYTGEPDDATLRAYFGKHRERYGEPARYDLRHIFLAGDDSLDRASALLKRLQAGEDPAGLGDPFRGGHRLRHRTGENLAGIFGSAFVDGLDAAPRDDWHLRQGSGGWHVVRIDRFVPAVEPDLDDVRDEVLADVRIGQRTRAVEGELRALRERYEVRSE